MLPGKWQRLASLFFAIDRPVGEVYEIRYCSFGNHLICTSVYVIGPDVIRQRER